MNEWMHWIVNESVHMSSVGWMDEFNWLTLIIDERMHGWKGLRLRQMKAGLTPGFAIPLDASIGPCQLFDAHSVALSYIVNIYAEDVIICNCNVKQFKSHCHVLKGITKRKWDVNVISPYWIIHQFFRSRSTGELVHLNSGQFTNHEGHNFGNSCCFSILIIVIFIFVYQKFKISWK